MVDTCSFWQFVLSPFTEHCSYLGILDTKLSLLRLFYFRAQSIHTLRSTLAVCVYICVYGSRWPIFWVEIRTYLDKYKCLRYIYSEIKINTYSINTFDI